MKSANKKQLYSIKIIGIDQNGTSVKLLSPMNGESPIPIKKGTRLAIHEELEGGESRSHVVVAGPDPNNVNQPYQYFDDKIDRWVLIVQQPEDRPITLRSTVRVETDFDVTLKILSEDSNQAEDAKTYEAKSKDLSATGMRLIASSDTEVLEGSKVILDFQLPDSSYELPPITGKIMRVIEDSGQYIPREYDLGIEFDSFEPVGQSSSGEGEDGKERVQNKNDQDEITRFVLEKQNL